MPRVVVVGAGIVGASIAYHLARRGTQVTLVERARPGSGATGSSFGWIGRHGRWRGDAAAPRGDTLAHWHRLEHELPGVDVRWTGSVTWQSEVLDAAVAAVSAREAVGVEDVRLLTAEQVAALEPNLREPPVRAAHLRGDGTVDPPAVTDALVRGARDHGAEVLLDVEVTGFRAVGTRVVAVETPVGVLRADEVVVAAGTAVPSLCAPLGVHVPVSASPAALVELEAPQGLVRTLVAAPGLEAREGADGRLLAAVDWNERNSQLEAVATRTTSAVSVLLRASSDVRVRAVRVGVRPMPADGTPIIGPVAGVAGLYLAVMHSGVTLAPMVGQLVAREVADQVETAELLDCRPARFTVRPTRRHPWQAEM